MSLANDIGAPGNIEAQAARASDFAQQIKDFTNKTFYRLDIFFQMLAEEMFKAVVIRTPVDTGKAEANWNIGINKIDKSTDTPPDQNPLSVIESKVEEIKKADATDTIWITNNMSYILDLEKGLLHGPTAKVTASGYSRKAPHGMVSVTVAQFQQYYGKALQKAKSKTMGTSHYHHFRNIRHRYNIFF